MRAPERGESHRCGSPAPATKNKKYEPDFPMVRTSATAPGRIVSKERLGEMGLVVAPERDTTITAFTARTSQGKDGRARAWSAKVWPDYSRSLAGAPPHLQGRVPTAA
jgi:hypothetical protein